MSFRMIRTSAAGLMVAAGMAVCVTPAVGQGLAPATAHEQPDTPQPIPGEPVVELAILLDTSNSMDGLIDQAKTRLWDIVNELATSKQAGSRPILRVGLYEYGNSRLDGKTGHIRQVLGLTTDLDAVSEQLFALNTSGGSEYCGWVIQEATQHLEWGASAGDLRMIVIAGNEPFTQGPVDYKSSLPAAIDKGIVVNTIFCGPFDEGVSTGWRDGAQLADGRYANIDQNQEMVHIPAPQDDQLRALNEQLNGTYIAYGREGAQRRARQSAQDKAAGQAAAGAELGRIAAKSSALYRNAHWDLVDAVKEETVDLDEIDEKLLPESMKKMSLDERKAYVAELASRRAGIQKQIQELDKQRRAYVDDKRREMSASGEDALDSAIIKALREAASKRGFEFEKK